MLNVSNLSKTYPAPHGLLTVLSDVTFSLDAGEAAAITGPSGSGKSTLLYVLGAIEPPTDGQITLDGRDPYSLSPTAMAEFRNQKIGFVFQDHCLLPQCTVLENVLVPTLVAPAGADPDEDVARARALLEQVGLSGRLDHRPGELSGGEKQRVAIARALIRQPRLLLCDEPTGNLDQATGSAVSSLLIDLHRQLRNILVVVTHSERLAAQFLIRFGITDGRLRRLTVV